MQSLLSHKDLHIDELCHACIKLLFLVILLKTPNRIYAIFLISPKDKM